MDKTKLVGDRNRDLADELGTVCRHIEQAAMAKGFTGNEVREGRDRRRGGGDRP